MGGQQIHAAVLHGIGQTPRYEPFPAPVAGDDEAVVTVTAAVLNLGMAAWKTLMWEGELAAGRNQRVLDQLLARGAEAAIKVDRPHDELVAATAGEVAGLPAMTLRSAPVQVFGSGIGGTAALEDAAAAYRDLLEQVAVGEIVLDLDPVPLADVERAWPRAGSDRRIVFVP
jgi:hypothetical protein